MHKGMLYVLITAMVSGVSIFLNSFAVKGFDSSVFTFAKNAAVAVLLLCVIIAVKDYKNLAQLTRKNWIQLVAIGLIGGSIPFLLFFKGLQMTAGTTSAFIHKTIFIYISIFAFLYLKERLSLKYFLGAAMLLAGTYLMIMPDFTFSGGHFLVLAATVFWAAENTYAKHVLKELTGNVVGFGRMFFGSLFMLLFLLATGKAGMIFSMSMPQYLWIALTSMLLLLYVFTYYNGLMTLPVSVAACILSLGAPITAVLSWVFLGQGIEILSWIGMALTVSGTAIAAWHGLRVLPHGRD